MNIEIVSVNVGKPRTILYAGKTLETGIYKQPVNERTIPLTTLNFEGDGQADLVHHGGTDKAVCVYPFEHYAYWERVLGRPLDCGAFGENLTVRGMTEDVVCIGDIYAIGDVRLQVSQPRQPCHKLAKKYGLPDLPLRVQNTGCTGFYFRVLAPGTFDRSLPFKRLERHPLGVTVAFANRIMHHDKLNAEGIRKLLAIAELSAHWRATLVKRLEETDTSTAKKPEGQ